LEAQLDVGGVRSGELDPDHQIVALGERVRRGRGDNLLMDS
jgi:hypothetical protein